MVLKKSNTTLNSGGTQREVTRGKVWLRGFIFNRGCDYDSNLITIDLPSTFLNADAISRSSDFHKTLEGLTFLAHHCDWEELADLDFRSIGCYSKRNDVPIKSFNMNKRKRWLLPQKLITLIITYNWLHPGGLPFNDDAVAGFIKRSKFGGLFRRNIRSTMNNTGVHVSDDFLDNVPQFCGELVRFGLMDVFRDFQLNVTSAKNCMGGIPRGNARDKIHTTSVCERGHRRINCRGHATDSKGGIIKRKPHPRGIQRPASWNKTSTSKRHKKQKQNKQEFDGDDYPSDINNTRGFTEPDSGEEQVSISIKQDVHVDKRLLEWTSVIKKYGHLPYNAPRKANCKTKRRFDRSRLSSHRHYRYATLKEETFQAQLEISRSNETTCMAPAITDNQFRNKKPVLDTYATHQSEIEHIENSERTSPSVRHEITLKDFLVEEKPRISRKRTKHASKPLETSLNSVNFNGNSNHGANNRLMTERAATAPGDLSLNWSFTNIDLNTYITSTDNVEADWVVINRDEMTEMLS